MASDNRFSVYTSTDHRAPLWIVTLLSLTYSLIFLLVRLGIKRRLLGVDDVWLGISYAFSIAQWGVVIRALDGGVGESKDVVPKIELSSSAKFVFASQILLLIALGFSKGSVVLFLRNLFTEENRNAWRLCNVLMVLIMAWTISAPLIVGTGCSPTSTLDTGANIGGNGDIKRWWIVTALDVCLEACMVALPAYLFTNIRMSMQKRLTVIAAFAFRVCVVAMFIIFLESHTTFVRHGRPNIDAVIRLIWQQVLVATSLFTATIPCLKAFLSNFKTGDSARLLEGYNFEPHASNGESQDESYVLASMRRRSAEESKSPPTREEFLSRPAANIGHLATAYAAGSRNKRKSSARSFGSEEMIIHRSSTIEWEVSDIEPQ